jgi:hypothetical protein
VIVTLIAPALYRMRRARRTSAVVSEPGTEQAEILSSHQHAAGHEGP